MWFAQGERFSRRVVRINARAVGAMLLPLLILDLAWHLKRSRSPSDFEVVVQQLQANDTSPAARIINVPGLKGARRREHVRNEFEKANYPFIFYDAERPTFANGTERTTGTKGLTLGEISLMQAHSRLYEELLASDEPYMLIGEDDIALCDDFAHKVSRLLRKLPTDFDAIKLEYGNKPQKRIPFLALARGSTSGLKIVEGMGGCCTGLYIVSPAGAKLFLRENPPENPVQTSDGVLDPTHVSTREIRLFHVVPPLAWQDKSTAVQSSGSHRDLGLS